MSLKSRIVAESFRPIKNNVFVTELERGSQATEGGIIIPDDNMTERGIRERWGKVFAVGPDVDDLKVGDWILIKHGRWTFGIELELPEGTTRVWRVEYPESVLLASETDPRINKPAQIPETVKHYDEVGESHAGVAPPVIKHRHNSDAERMAAPAYLRSPYDKH